MGLFDDRCDQCNRKAEYFSSNNSKLCPEDWDAMWKEQEKHAQQLAQQKLRIEDTNCNEGHKILEPLTCDACKTLVHDVVQVIRGQRQTIESDIEEHRKQHDEEDKNQWGLDIPDGM
jgi:hypothetical protein